MSLFGLPLSIPLRLIACPAELKNRSERGHLPTALILYDSMENIPFLTYIFPKRINEPLEEGQ